MYKIDQRKVAGVAAEASAALDGKGFNHGEVALGLAELLGRTVVAAVDTPSKAQELLKVTTAHAARTVKLGVEVQEKQPSMVS